MGFWDFASAHPVALFFIVVAIGWALTGMFHGHGKNCCSNDCCKKDKS